ncbi:MAG TPA: hydrogenase maturation nickel metallochaperone HypA [Pseudonocardiaceae bacterium]|nr:hydrogenase maturation nickel metallochaperone HypA [Pseudonocardiaceae bacterium]
MHELSIAESVVQAVVSRMGQARVGKVVLEIGRLSGVVPDSLLFCFDLVTEGTTLQGCSLEIVELTGLARCRACGAHVELTDLLALCECGSLDLEVLSGDQLRIREVEVEHV